MILTLTGSNSFALKDRLNKLILEFVSQYSDLALERLDGEEVETQVILDAVANLPLLSAKKMIVVRNLGSNKQAAEQIEQIISSARGDVDLILYEPQIDKRTNYYKVLKAQTEFNQINELDTQELAKWLVEHGKNKDADLKLSDAIYLIERVGANQMLLANELEKLAIYNKQISRDNIDLLTEKTPQSKIFDLLDAAFAGNKKQALNLYAQQRAQKVDPKEIIAMFAWQLRLIATVKYAGDKRPAEVAKDLGMSSYPVTKALSLANKISEVKLINLVETALEIDKLGKTKPINLDEALKTYIITI